MAGGMAKYLAIIAFLLSTLAAHAERRVALVIGNAAYESTAPLANPVNDAEDLAAALTRVGFEVQVERNLSKRGMETALARFARSAEDADAAMFFFAGHGIQYRGTNYLMPVDARLDDEISVNYELLRIDEVLFGLGRARGVRLLVLDACRNNPLLDRLLRRASTRDVGLTRGLARIDAARGMVVAYSTQADQVAVDGAGRNSPFTSALVRYLDEPGLEVGSLFRRVAIEVDRATGGRQLPELSITLRGEFYLNTRESDLQAWSRIRASDDTRELAEFIQRYPNSVLAGEVRQRMVAIERARVEREDRERTERAAREQAERERLAREQMERERIERERVAQERLAREQTALVQAERERAAREQVERERVAREQILREQAERLERERIAREQAAQAAPAGPHVAMLPPASEPAPPQAPALSGAALVREIKKELKRVGCHAGAIDDRWASADTQASIAKLARHAKLQTAPEQPSIEFLDAIRRSTARVCPLECSLRQVEKDGACIAKVCPRGQLLTNNGRCEERRKSRTAARTPPAGPSQPRSSEGAATGGPRGGVQEAVRCGRRGCISGGWSQTRIPGMRCRGGRRGSGQMFCN